MGANRFALIMAFYLYSGVQQSAKFASKSEVPDKALPSSRMVRKARDFIPEGCGQIPDDGFGSAADDDPLERKLARRIDLLVRKPRRNIDEIARV